MAPGSRVGLSRVLFNKWDDAAQRSLWPARRAPLRTIVLGRSAVILSVWRAFTGVAGIERTCRRRSDGCAFVRRLFDAESFAVALRERASLPAQDAVRSSESYVWREAEGSGRGRCGSRSVAVPGRTRTTCWWTARLEASYVCARRFRQTRPVCSTDRSAGYGLARSSCRAVGGAASR